MQNALSDVGVLAFAGGGNRCWWQAGVLTHLLERGMQLPRTLIGTSAGAAMAASCLTIGPEAALAACVRLFAENRRVFHWPALARMKLHFAHQQTYPAWVAAIVNAATFPALQRTQQRLLVAVSRPAPLLGKHLSIAAGTVAYMIDKKVFPHIHPRLPRWLGLKQDFFDAQQCATHDEAQALLNAAAAAPPFMHPVSLHGRWALDGGYVDNAPIPHQTAAERASTLVLLTRHYPKRPAHFSVDGRRYWQPSRRVPVSTWDCTARTTVMQAFELGYEDARAMLA